MSTNHRAKDLDSDPCSMLHPISLHHTIQAIFKSLAVNENVPSNLFSVLPLSSHFILIVPGNLLNMFDDNFRSKQGELLQLSTPHEEAVWYVLDQIVVKGQNLEALEVAQGLGDRLETVVVQPELNQCEAPDGTIKFQNQDAEMVQAQQIIETIYNKMIIVSPQHCRGSIREDHVLAPWSPPIQVGRRDLFTPAGVKHQVRIQYTGKCTCLQISKVASQHIGYSCFLAGPINTKAAGFHPLEVHKLS
mmetsp:Transcript_15476/g.29793  ORF Transcript_15476/g.29793 Transcript_15476/m.29793 type:complete len:247 (-) Transcript_15476:865-1605(-)